VSPICFTLPDGISGDYYVIVYADAGNAVNEYLFEGDNITVSSATSTSMSRRIPICAWKTWRSPAPDVKNVFTITWNTANRGNAPRRAGFMDAFPRAQPDQWLLLTNVEQTVAGSIAVNGPCPPDDGGGHESAAFIRSRSRRIRKTNIFE